MKKIRTLVVLLVVVGAIFSNPSLAEAAENKVEIVSMGNYSKEAILEEEYQFLQQVISEDMNVDSIFLPQATRASYQPYRYSESFNIYINDSWVARADAECIVWHYTDGKVHLYNRTITVTRLATYDASRTYGSIVNTDGSLSYTTGDRVHLYGLTNTWDFAIDFRVTPTEASFDCYEV